MSRLENKIRKLEEQKHALETDIQHMAANNQEMKTTLEQITLFATYPILLRQKENIIQNWNFFKTFPKEIDKLLKILQREQQLEEIGQLIEESRCEHCEQNPIPSMIHTKPGKCRHNVLVNECHHCMVDQQHINCNCGKVAKMYGLKKMKAKKSKSPKKTKAKKTKSPKRVNKK